MKERLRLIAVLLLFITGVFTLNCSLHTNEKVGQKIHHITEPYEFSLVEWELNSLGNQLWSSLKPASNVEIKDIKTVEAYFNAIRIYGSTDAALETQTEDILKLQIQTVLIEEGITHPLDKWVPSKTIVPPLNFEFHDPPHLLVISPRDEIKLLSRTVLDPVIATTEKELIEQRVDLGGYSSLVSNLGGVGFTYPTMIYRTSNIHQAIEIVVEEWFHQYMGLQPLGWGYLLDSAGLKSDSDIVTMNETVAGIVSKEIADIVYEKYYAELQEDFDNNKKQSNFNFDSEMRQIRLTVDQLLASGRVEQAESYMNERRDFLASNGYHIRKLNQAYFAFHGSYADDPETVSPIGQNLQELRKGSASLREFLNSVRGMTSYNDLKDVLEESDK